MENDLKTAEVQNYLVVIRMPELSACYSPAREADHPATARAPENPLLSSLTFIYFASILILILI